MKAKGIVWLLFVAVACQPRALTEAELEAYTRDPANGVRMTRKVDDIAIDLIFKPVDLLVARALRNPTPTAVDSARALYDSSYYFVAGFSRNNRELLTPSSANNFPELVTRMSFEIGDYVYLTTSEQDTIPTANFALDRTFGSGQSTNIIFAFPSKKLKSARTLYINVREFGLGVGPLVFEFDGKKIAEIPPLDSRILQK